MPIKIKSLLLKALTAFLILLYFPLTATSEESPFNDLKLGDHTIDFPFEHFAVTKSYVDGFDGRSLFTVNDNSGTERTYTFLSPMNSLVQISEIWINRESPRRPQLQVEDLPELEYGLSTLRDIKNAMDHEGFQYACKRFFIEKGAISTTVSYVHPSISRAIITFKAELPDEDSGAAKSDATPRTIGDAIVTGIVLARSNYLRTSWCPEMYPFDDTSNIQIEELFTKLSAPQNSANGRWFVVGNEIRFDMSIPYHDNLLIDSLELEDVRQFWSLVDNNPQVTTLALTGPGGNLEAAVDLGEAITYLEFDTKAYGKCASSCALIFLSGQERTLEPNAELGFHRPYTNADDERSYYNDMKNLNGWRDEFDYATFLYDEASLEILEMINFMTRQGVSFPFIYEALNFGADEMWYPSVERLRSDGIITSHN